MTKRRNSYTAVLFLAGLVSALLYLGLGLGPTATGFRAMTRPTLSASDSLALKRPLTPAEKRERKKEPVYPDRSANLRPLRHPLEVPVPTFSDALDAFCQLTQDADPALNELLDRDHAFIELYGGVQRLLGRRIIEDADPQYTVVRLEGDLLTFVDLDGEQVDMTTRAEEMIDFARRISKEYHTPLLYVQAPSKLNVSPLPDGIEEYSDREADQFLALLKEGKVDTLDLRPAFVQAAQEDPEGARDLFYRTDHHWSPQGAFLGYQTLCEKLEKRYRFKIDEKLTDPEEFDKYSFRAAFLGSQGRRVGSLYAGEDDVEIWSPKFSTNLTYTVPLLGVTREGPFVVSMLFPERLAETDRYETNPYTIYAGGDYLLSRAYNEKISMGKRVLVLRDSFGCGLTPFLSLCCQEVIAMDPRQFNGNQDMMMHYIDWLEPDLVIVLNSTGSLRVDKLYPYLPTARAAALADKRTEEMKSEK